MDRDTAERLMRMRVVLYPALAGTVIGGMVAVYLVATLHVRIGLAAMAALGVGVAGGAMGRLAWWGIGRIGNQFVTMVTASGAVRGDPTFSLEESLIARGRHAEAAERFQAHLLTAPTDHGARLALAALLTKPLGQWAEAVRLYEDVQAGSPTPNQAFEAANALIDLYRSTGQRGRLLTALARFSHRYHGTNAGRAAKRELSELKQTEL